MGGGPASPRGRNRKGKAGGARSNNAAAAAAPLPFANLAAAQQQQAQQVQQAQQAQAQREAAAAQQAQHDAMRSQAVAALRDEGRELYLKRCYRDSIMRYSQAIRVHTNNHTAASLGGDPVLAVIYGNRAAALVMVGAYHAAECDCRKALENVVDVEEVNGQQVPVLKTEGGAALRSKLLCRQGRAFLKQGNASNADRAFDAAISVARNALAHLGVSEDPAVPLPPQLAALADEAAHQALQVLRQAIVDAFTSKLDVRRSREATQAIVQASQNAPPPAAGLAARLPFSQRLLRRIDAALALTPGNVGLQVQKANLLVSMRHWVELGRHCERLACEFAKFDGVFAEDLAVLNPFPGIPPAQHLRPEFFDDDDEDEAASVAEGKKLDAKAASEAALRLPLKMLPLYLRSLRLEERYGEATKVGDALEAAAGGDPASVARTYAWLPAERDRLRRTMSTKERGDEKFRAGAYEGAAAQYARCLLIDSEVEPQNPNSDPTVDGSNAGGRLHAVLHCNRAACFMALKLHGEAAKECAAALRIHPTYMKAMLRRARCYARLGRREESMAEYRGWVRLVEEAVRASSTGAGPAAAAASASSAHSTSESTCNFDRAADITPADLGKVKAEIAELRRTQADAKRAEEETRSQAKANRQNFYDEYNSTRNSTRDSFRRSASERHGGGGAGGAGNANRGNERRRQWYGQEGRDSSRRWDSFNGSGPKAPPPAGAAHGGRSSQQQRGQSSYASGGASQRGSFNAGSSSRAAPPPPREEPRASAAVGSPSADADQCHYAVLGLTPTATIAEIKKAYKKLALKFHPDKNKEEGATEIFRRVKLAYELLSDESTKRKYDAEARLRRYTGFRF